RRLLRCGPSLTRELDETLGHQRHGVAERSGYVCVTKVLLLGLSDVREHFSHGELPTEWVWQSRHLAKEHGFSVLIKDDQRRKLARAMCGRHDPERSVSRRRSRLQRQKRKSSLCSPVKIPVNEIRNSG